MKTKYKVLTLICCVVVLAGLTVGIVYAVSDRNTADNDTVDPSEVDKFTVDEEYADVLEQVREEADSYYIPDLYANDRYINRVLSSSKDLSITEDNIADIELYDGHIFYNWRTNGFDESVIMELYIKKAIAMQYRYYLCEQYVSDENADNAAVKSWLAYRIKEVASLIHDIQYEIYDNMPEPTGYGGEPGYGDGTDYASEPDYGSEPLTLDWQD